MVLYSVKMHSSRGSCHGFGGRHISGAERILQETQVDSSVIQMIRRARVHERGAADFIQIKVEEIPEKKIQYCPLLSIHETEADTPEEGRRKAIEELQRAGVSRKAAESGMAFLAALNDSMRGAVVIDAAQGCRLDHSGQRGVRCSCMDCMDNRQYEDFLQHLGLTGVHVREALVLASKVEAAPGIAAELCWSDDPNYVTGYVASPARGYFRIPQMKSAGDCVGGRVFFVRPGTDIHKFQDYMENQAVLVRCPS